MTFMSNEWEYTQREIGVCFKPVFKYKHERLQGILESTQKGLVKMR
jgi:hypothetical protein